MASASRQIRRMVELQRRIKIAMEALRAVESSLARELGPDASSGPDPIARDITNATKAAILRKAHN